jgi:hypothetical protein
MYLLVGIYPLLSLCRVATVRVSHLELVYSA